MFFDGWHGILRILVVAPLAYCGLILMLRVSGKRTLTKMNAFDLVVTVALGSTLATAILSKDTPLADGLVAFAMLILLQWAVTQLSMRHEKSQSLIKAQPRLLLHRGEILADALRKERVTEEELKAAVREAGLASLAMAEAIVLETNGRLSVIPASASTAAPTALQVVAGFRDSAATHPA